ncbi:universal stress protein [Demetria terragena]|uniref:universal stress protein n=1 Tax=Demetria terragena TaxID=63959 RepID=UPI00036D89B7|nr:universal stress protein [Demetria terragena]
MPVLVVDQATPESAAAFAAGLDEARRRSEDVVVVALADGSGLTAESPEDVKVTHQVADERDRDPVGALLDVAAQLEPSVIVIGVKHRSPTGKLLFGSVAQQILLEAHCPVLSVKAPRNQL